MTTAQRKLTISSDNKMVIEDRKCLGMIHQNKLNQQHLANSTKTASRGKKRKTDENYGVVKCPRKDKIYQDPVSPPLKKGKIWHSTAVQTDSTPSPPPALPTSTEQDDIIHMLTSDTPTPVYWESLAEQRRVALEEALEENRTLWEENQGLRGEVAQLQEDNKLLEEMVDEAKQLASLVQSITDEIKPEGASQQEEEETSQEDTQDESEAVVLS